MTQKQSKSKTFQKGTDFQEVADFLSKQIETTPFDLGNLDNEGDCQTTSKYLITITKDRGQKGGMRHGSLFSGIGGFDLAAQWMGWENVFQVEIDLFCQKVLEKNFPGVARYGDIKEFDGTKYRGTVDIISGGFPCQPFSVAGKRKGKDDDRFLWPEMLRVIREAKPSFIVGENVTGIIGLALDQVLTEVEAEGYYTETFIIPACGVDAPHRRDRLWVIAYSESGYDRRAEREIYQADGRPDGELLSAPISSGQGLCETRPVTNSNKPRLSNRISEGFGCVQKTTDPFTGGESSRIYPAHERWREFPTQSPLCGGDEWIPNRVDRIKALGNAIVPQIAFEIFKAIQTVIDNDPTRTKA